MNNLWYEQSAQYWDEALPLGNGRLGAMVYGRTDEEIIQLNEESLWSGKKIDRCNPDSLSHLKTIRQFILDGQIREAEKLALLALSGTPQSQRCYQTFGEIIMHYEKAYEEERYFRELDLNTGIARMEVQTAKGRLEQEIFISRPADCMVIHLLGKGEEQINFSCRLDRGRYFDKVCAVSDYAIMLEGDNGGISFAGILGVAYCDGIVETIGENIIVKNAKEAILLFSAATSNRTESPKQIISQIYREAESKSFQILQSEHIKDYSELFKRVDLNFEGGGEYLCDIPTDKRLERLKSGKDDPDLIATYFQYGRYLMICSSREGGLPATLQGIWNSEYTPPWDSKYTVNINLQMNYWMADACNLGECLLPFFVHLKKMMEDGKDTAEKMYGCRGFVVHHNTDIYGDTKPQDLYIPATYWVMGGAWLALHIWEHYEFTGDIRFLREYYIILKEAVLFFIDFLTEDKEGRLVTVPTVSPENTYIMEDGTRGCLCAGCTMDNEILRDLFQVFIKASVLLDTEQELVSETKRIRDKILPPQVGRFGQIMEWMEDYDEAEPGHRHISQLYGVFPSAQINDDETPELMKAAKITLERRLKYGGGHTGWSRAWIILLWDRFRDGEKSYENLKELLCNSTFHNLMDNHPYDCVRGKVFQIDGNFGAVMGITEMLIQSHNKKIEILPALPHALANGCVSGLRVRGNGEISMAWKEGTLEYFSIITQITEVVHIHYGENFKTVKVEAGKKYTFNKDLESLD